MMRKAGGATLLLRLFSRYGNEIYGICALWVVGLHAVGLFGVDLIFGLSALEPFVWFLRQNLTVDVFVLLSGISCYYSYSSHPESGRFLSKCLARVYPALMVTYGVSLLLSVLVGSQSVSWFLWNMSLAPFFVEGNLNGAWYVSFIVLMYFFYPYMHRFIYRNKDSEPLILMRTILLMAVSSTIYWLCHKYALDRFNLVESAFARTPSFCLAVVWAIS